MTRYEAVYLQETKVVIDANDIADVVNRLRTQDPSIHIISINEVRLEPSRSSGDSHIVSVRQGSSTTSATTTIEPTSESKPKSIQRATLSKRFNEELPPIAHLDTDAVASTLEKVKSSTSDEDWAAQAIGSNLDEVDQFSEPSAVESSNDDAYTATLSKYGAGGATGAAIKAGRTPPKAIQRAS